MQRVYNLKKSLQPLVSAQTLKKLVTMADRHAVQVSVDITSDIVCPWCVETHCRGKLFVRVFHDLVARSGAGLESGTLT